MSVSNPSPTSTQPSALRTLAFLLEKLDRQPGPVGGDQYRSVVDKLRQELTAATPGPALDELLDAHPSAAELYENLHYEHAGLCRHDLDAALASEQRARAMLERIRRL